MGNFEISGGSSTNPLSVYANPRVGYGLPYEGAASNQAINKGTVYYYPIVVSEIHTFTSSEFYINASSASLLMQSYIHDNDSSNCAYWPGARGTILHNNSPVNGTPRAVSASLSWTPSYVGVHWISTLLTGPGTTATLRAVNGHSPFVNPSNSSDLGSVCYIENSGSIPTTPNPTASYTPCPRVVIFR